MEETIYREAKKDEWESACEFVADVFQENVAPHYSPEGCAEFIRFIRPKAMAERAANEGKVILALEGGEIVGLIEIRASEHIALLFVQTYRQGHGIGRGLLQRALAACRVNRPELETVSVNASPNAVGAYERFGFMHAGGKQEKNGIIFYPMHLPLS